MPVRTVKHETRCKLCVHEKAQQINELLLLRSKREQDAAGTQITLTYVLEKFAEWGVANPNADNVKSHVKRHIEFVSETKVEEEQERAEEVIGQLARGELEFADLDDGLRFLATVYIEEQKTKYAKGESLGLTHDHFLKLVGESTKRKHNDSQDRLLDALSGGIGAVFEKALSPSLDAPALPAGDEIVGEIVHESEVIVGADGHQV